MSCLTPPTQNPPDTRKFTLVLVALAGLMGLVLLPACTNAEKTPELVVPSDAPTTLASPTPLPATATQRPRITPSKTPTPTVRIPATATQGVIATHTPFPRDLDHYFLRYDPNATPVMPQEYSIDFWNLWRSYIPVTPVEATPQFVAYPPPADLAYSMKDLLVEAGCLVDENNISCPPESPLSRFDCQWNYARFSRIAYPATHDITLVSPCAIRMDRGEINPEYVYRAGCAFPLKIGYIFKVKGEYILANTVQQMEDLLLPIESASEALTYAQLMTGIQADFTPTFDPTLLYLQDTITGTHVTQMGGSYSMNLYHSQGCGCEPWITTEIMLQVDRDGTITWVSALPVYLTTGYSCAD